MAAICETPSGPTMRFIAVKSIEQQSMLCVHRLREGIKEDGALARLVRRPVPRLRTVGPLRTGR